jgi:hypothetical protein
MLLLLHSGVTAANATFRPRLVTAASVPLPTIASLQSPLPRTAGELNARPQLSTVVRARWVRSPEPEALEIGRVRGDVRDREEGWRSQPQPRQDAAGCTGRR